MPGRICGNRRTSFTRCRRTGRRGRGEGGRQKAEGIHHRGTEGTEAGREEGRNEAGRRRRSWNDQRVPSAEALGSLNTEAKSRRDGRTPAVPTGLGSTRMSTFFSPGGVEELYPKLVGLSPEELSTVVEPFGSGIVGPPIDE